MKTRKYPAAPGNTGFTLIEVVAILIIIGIVSAVVYTKMPSIDAGKIGDINMIKSHLRYTQTRAMADSERRWGITFSGTTYSLYRDDNGDGAFAVEERRVLPGADAESVTLQSSLSCSATLAFDWWGAPFTDAACSTPMTSGALSFGSDAITVTPLTGFIP